MKTVLFSILLIILTGCNYVNPDCLICGCSNVDDCLSKYKFEEARKYASNIKEVWRPKQMVKIISAEAEYWVTQKEFSKALVLCKELSRIKIENKLDFSEGDKQEFYIKTLYSLISAKVQSNNMDGINELVDEMYISDEPNSIKSKCYKVIINKYCENRDYDGAKKVVIKLPEQTISRDKEYISYGSSQEGESEVQTCRKKYNSIKKGLKQNQEIEPFKESDSDYYIITTYEYPQKEALKIIEEYKKR
jgi:hypothetical protein